MKTIVNPIVFLIILVSLTACGATRAQVIEQYKEPFAKKREQLTTIAESLPPVGSVVENSYCENMDPGLILKDNNFGKEITGAMLMYDQVLDPDIDLRSSFIQPFDVRMNSPFLYALRCTGPQNPMADSAMKKYDDGFADNLKTALATPYLVINRVAEYTPAYIVDKNSFLPGQVIIEGFVISMENTGILCSYRVEVATSEEMIYYRETGDDLDRALAPVDALQITLEKETRLAIQETLTEITGGTIKYSEHSLP